MDVSLERRIEILEENMEQLRDVPVRLSAVESQNRATPSRDADWIFCAARTE